MEIEQLSIFPGQSDPPPIVFDRPFSPRYIDLPNDGKIYTKIDWLTVVFFNCSMNDVLAWLDVTDCVTDFCLSRFEQSRGYDMLFKFNYNGILLETSQFSFYGLDYSDVGIFDIVVPKIRLELSGSALDYLRSIGLNMDTHRLTVPVLPEGASYHCTRCDWAFDFINYHGDFVDMLIDHINTHKLPSERVPLASTKGAISCKVVTGGQKTVYLGSPQSDRMLRVYDKRMQHIDLCSQVYNKPNPYNNPDSWFRIEWQTRNKFANNLVFGADANGEPADFKSILRDIFDLYAFADGTVDNHNSSRPPVEFWLSLFNWQDLEKRIVQNLYSVQYIPYNERVFNSWCSTMMPSTAFVYSMLGPQGFEKVMNDYLKNLQEPDPLSVRRFCNFLNKLNMCGDHINLDPDVSHGLVNISGVLRFVL